MGKGKIVRSSDVIAFTTDNKYFSKMIIDQYNSESKRLQINEGTLKPGYETPGAVHKAPYDEVYYVIKGEALLNLDGEKYVISPGTVVFIPGDTFHSLKNLSSEEDFVILTIWPLQPEPGVNEVYDLRIKEWGDSFKTIEEKDQTR